MIDGTQAGARFPLRRYPTALIDRVVLAEDRSVTIRPVLPQGADAEHDFVGRLSSATRQRRFHVSLCALPGRSSCSASHSSTIARTSRGRPRCQAMTATCAPATRRPPRSRASLTTAGSAPARRRERIQLLARHARRLGVQNLYGGVQSDHRPMPALARRLGARMAPVAGDAAALCIRFEISAEVPR